MYNAEFVYCRMTDYLVIGADRNQLERSDPCSKSADVLFIVDSSTSLDLYDLRSYVVAVIRDIVLSVRVDTRHIRVAAVSYGTSARV